MRNLIACLLSGISVLSADAAEIRLMTTNYPPYFASILPDGGPLTEIVVDAFTKVGHDVTIDFVPWARAMEYAKAGRADGLHGAWFSEERERYFIFSNALPSNELVLFKRRGEEPDRFTSYRALRPYTIGIVRAYRNPIDFDDAGLRTNEATSDTANLVKLANGRVDLVLIDRAVANYVLSTELTEYGPELEALEPPVEVLPMHLLLSRQMNGHESMMSDFNRGLEMLQADGTIEKIMRRHGM